MTLYLIRHGKTEANLRHQYCGSTDLSLSPIGQQELLSLRAQYPDLSHCRFLTSGMRRTEETLLLLFGDVPHSIDPRLREMDFGIFELGSYETLKDTPAYHAWISGDNEANVPPGGESGERMRRRVLEALTEILAAGQDTVILTHGGVIACILAPLFPQAKKSRYQWQPQPGHGYAVTDTDYTPLP